MNLVGSANATADPTIIHGLAVDSGRTISERETNGSVHADYLFHSEVELGATTTGRRPTHEGQSHREDRTLRLNSLHPTLVRTHHEGEM